MSTMSTMSTSTLQNNIGALMLFKGSSIPLATKRFYSSFVTSISNDNNNHDDDNDYDDDDESQLLSSQILSIIGHPLQVTTSIDNHNQNSSSEKQGLIWFHNKLLREVLSTKSQQQQQQQQLQQQQIQQQQQQDYHYNHSTIITTNTNANTNNTNSNGTTEEENDFFMYHHYHMNENIPLGLEYIHDPIICINNNDDDQVCDMNVTIASGINLALCLWSSHTTYYNDEIKRIKRIQHYDNNNNNIIDEKKLDHNNNNDNNDNNNFINNNNDNKMKQWSRNRIIMTKANDSVQVLELILDYVEKQKQKCHVVGTNHDNTDLDSYCYRCQQKKMMKKKQRQPKGQHNSSTRSWANVLQEVENNEKEDQEDSDNDDDVFIEESKKSLLSCPDQNLLVILHNNIGVLYFILNKVKQALHHFEEAKSIITKYIEPKQGVQRNFDRRKLLQASKYIPLKKSYSSYSKDQFSRQPSIQQQQHQQQHQQQQILLPSLDYLHLTTLLNLTRVTIRMNGMIEHAKTTAIELQNFVDSMTNSDTSLQGLSSSKSLNEYQHKHHSYTSSFSSSSIFHHPTSVSSSATSFEQQHRVKWLITVSTNYIPGLLQQRLEHYTPALEHYNTMLSHTRKELGHDHLFVATVLEKKANILFDQRKCQTAMLSYLASLRIYEHQPSPIRNDVVCNGYQLEQSRLIYAIGRTLHDREEYADALSMYQKALSLLQSTNHKNRSILVDSIQIMCNIGRIYQIMGDLELCLNVNLKIVDVASEMVGGRSSSDEYDGHQILHPFVRNRLVVVGNVYVEMGRLSDAMSVFARVARGSGEEGTDWMVGHLRPEVEDVDTSAFAVRAAERLGELGSNNVSHHSAAA